MHLGDGSRVDERGRAHLHGGAPGDQELERVLRPRDSSDADHRDAYRTRRLVYQVDGERADRRPGKAAGPAAAPGLVLVESERHAAEPVDRAERAGTPPLARR